MKKNKSKIIYSDTDSNYITLYEYFKEIDCQKFFDSLTQENKVKICEEFSNLLENYINKKCFEELQQECYNSVETDFRIQFNKERIASCGIWLAKKKYSLRTLYNKGFFVDEIYSKGVELIRSDTPEIVKPFLTNIVESILKEKSDEELKHEIFKYEEELASALPEELATNISCSDINKFQLPDYKTKKGTPMHIKGAINYRFLRKKFNLEKQYEDIVDHTKVKVIYLKQNKWNLESLSFLRWPKELESQEILPNKTKMIDKYFFKKIEMYLNVIGKKDLTNKNNLLIDEFF